MSKKEYSPKTITNVIFTLFILALGMSPLELARLESGSPSTCPEIVKIKAVNTASQ